MSDGTRQVIFLRDIYKNIEVHESKRKETYIQKAINVLIEWGKRSLRKML